MGVVHKGKGLSEAFSSQFLFPPPPQGSASLIADPSKHRQKRMRASTRISSANTSPGERCVSVPAAGTFPQPPRDHVQDSNIHLKDRGDAAHREGGAALTAAHPVSTCNIPSPTPAWARLDINYTSIYEFPGRPQSQFFI